MKRTIELDYYPGDEVFLANGEIPGIVKSVTFHRNALKPVYAVEYWSDSVVNKVYVDPQDMSNANDPSYINKAAQFYAGSSSNRLEYDY